MVRIVPYSTQYMSEWDSFVDKSKNGTFLFKRDYMDYHSDRFIDSSLIFTKKDEIIALFPASIHSKFLSSHEGLTYGGFIVGKEISLLDMEDLFPLLFDWAATKGIDQIVYKTIPHIYHSYPAEEDLYWIYTNGGELIRRDTLTVVDNRNRNEISGRRLRGCKKAVSNNIAVRESEDFEGFWSTLEDNLLTRYNRKPVHSVYEIMLLKSRFPENIKLYVSEIENRIVGGAIVYLTSTVCHIQYNASNEEGRRLGGLDLLFNELLLIYKDIRWFDFGISNDYDRSFQIRWLNEGLVTYKEGFGGRTIIHDHYKFHI